MFKNLTYMRLFPILRLYIELSFPFSFVIYPFSSHYLSLLSAAQHSVSFVEFRLKFIHYFKVFDIFFL